MKFKLIIALVSDDKVDPVLDAARRAGATGCTVITSARGEGLRPKKSFFGLDLASQRDIALLVVEEHLSRDILEAVAEAGHFDDEPETGIAIQIPIEDAVGLSSQIAEISKKIEDEI